jgi:sortase (surface protein transpeptidase)
MKVLRSLALLTLVAGIAMLAAGFLLFRGGDDTPAPIQSFDVRETATQTPLPTTTELPTATPTPIPYDGQVARLKVPRLGIDNAIESIGILADNTLDTPHDAINKVGWYDIYPKPGFGANSVFSAHVNYNFRLGPFAELAKAEPGDEIDVVMENGLLYKYKVFRKQRYDVDTIPMGDLIWPKDRPTEKEWVTLITCGGRFVATQANGLGEYRDRDVVVAERIQ